MSGYEYEDDDTDYTPYVLAGVGGAGGRLIGRKLAGKAGKVKIKGKKKGGGKTSKELRSDRFANIGTGAGAGSGYAVGGIATGDETVRNTLDRVIEAREAARSAGEAVMSPTGRQLASDALWAAGLGTAASGFIPASRIVKRLIKETKSKKKGKAAGFSAADIKDYKQMGKLGAAGVGMGIAHGQIKPERRQSYNPYDVVPSPVFQDSYDPYSNRRR